MNLSLFHMDVGALGKISGFDEAKISYKKRLLSMGITPNTPFKVTRIAPMGDPIEIKIKDYRLSLRKEEAKTIMVEEIEP